MEKTFTEKFLNSVMSFEDEIMHGKGWIEFEDLLQRFIQSDYGGWFAEYVCDANKDYFSNLLKFFLEEDGVQVLVGNYEYNLNFRSFR